MEDMFLFIILPGIQVVHTLGGSGGGWCSHSKAPLLGTVEGVQTFGTQGAEIDSGTAILAEDAIDGAGGISRFYAIFNAPLTNPFLDLTEGNSKVFGDLIFIYIILADIFFDFLKKHHIQTCRAIVVLVTHRKTFSAGLALVDGTEEPLFFAFKHNGPSINYEQ